MKLHHSDRRRIPWIGVLLWSAANLTWMTSSVEALSEDMLPQLTNLNATTESNQSWNVTLEEPGKPDLRTDSQLNQTDTDVRAGEETPTPLTPISLPPILPSDPTPNISNNSTNSTSPTETPAEETPSPRTPVEVEPVPTGVPGSTNGTVDDRSNSTSTTTTTTTTTTVSNEASTTTSTEQTETPLPTLTLTDVPANTSSTITPQQSETETPPPETATSTDGVVPTPAPSVTATTATNTTESTPPVVTETTPPVTLTESTPPVTPTETTPPRATTSSGRITETPPSRPTTTTPPPTEEPTPPPTPTPTPTRTPTIQLPPQLPITTTTATSTSTTATSESTPSPTATTEPPVPGAVDTPAPSPPRDQDNASPNGPGGVIHTERPGLTTGNPQNAPVISADDQPNLPPSTDTGKSMLNLMPQTEGYRREPVQQLPPGAPVIVIRFLRPCGGICTEEAERKRFEAGLKQDIVDAFAQSQIPSTRVIAPEGVLILNVASIDNGANMAVQLSLVPKEPGVRVADLVRELERQIRDPNSFLATQGKFTGALDVATFGVDIMKPISSDSLSDAPGLPAGWIVAISVGVYLTLMVAFMVAYRRYKRRAKEQELEAARHRSMYYKGVRLPGRQHDSVLTADTDGYYPAAEQSGRTSRISKPVSMALHDPVDLEDLELGHGTAEDALQSMYAPAMTLTSSRPGSALPPSMRTSSSQPTYLRGVRSEWMGSTNMSVASSEFRTQMGQPSYYAPTNFDEEDGMTTITEM